MFRKWIISLAGGLALLAPSSALAGHTPFAFGDAQRGDLRVISGAFIAHKSADLRGVWLDESVECNQFRSLRVAAIVDYSRGQATRTIRRGRVGAVQNCAEGGPNFGFTVKARNVSLACANGNWKPGFYTFTVRTTHRATKISAVVSLGWENTVLC